MNPQTVVQGLKQRLQQHVLQKLYAAHGSEVEHAIRGAAVGGFIEVLEGQLQVPRLAVLVEFSAQTWGFHGGSVKWWVCDGKYHLEMEDNSGVLPRIGEPPSTLL